MRSVLWVARTIVPMTVACFVFGVVPVRTWGQQPATQAQAEQDPILKAMLVELGRNQKRLQLHGSYKPYSSNFASTTWSSTTRGLLMER